METEHRQFSKKTFVPDAIKGLGADQRPWILKQRTKHEQHRLEGHQKFWLVESHTDNQKESCLFQGRQAIVW